MKRGESTGWLMVSLQKLLRPDTSAHSCCPGELSVKGGCQRHQGEGAGGKDPNPLPGAYFTLIVDEK